MPNGDATQGFVERFTSMFALPQVVGRERELNQIVSAFQKTNPPRIFFLFGEGGVGKTRLLKEILVQLKDKLGDEAHVAEREVDLYHTITHTPNGLADALYDVAPFLEETRIKKLMEEMRGLWAAAVAGESAKLRKEHLQLFEQILKIACKDRPVIFTLDTAERWVYRWMDEDFPVDHVADAWRWLLKLLDQCDNLYFIISGRPAARVLYNELEENHTDWNAEVLDLGPLDEDGVLEYFEAIEQLAKQHLNNNDEAKRKDAEIVLRWLKNFPQEARKAAYTWSQGNPIRLSLLIDYLLMGGDVKDIPSSVSDDGATWEALYFELLANRYPDIFETVMAMARLPKGATPTLLALLMEESEREAEKCLQAIERYTFTKKLITPWGDERYFLHDELYHICSQVLPDDPGEQAKAGSKLREYYKKEIKYLQKRITAAFRTVEERGEVWCPGREDMTEFYLTRHALMTEDIYYVLRGNVEQGLRYRYRFTRNADLAGDVALDLSLQAEVLNFFDEPGAPNVDEDLKRTIYGMMAMRPVVRAWVEERHNEVWGLAEKLRQDKSFIQAGQNCAILDIWEAYAHIMSLEGELKNAEDLLEHAIKKTKKYESKELDGDFVIWRGKAILAFALRVRGYLRDNLGRLDEAIADYRRSVKLWREVNLLMELATTTKDLAFNLARIGRYPEAEDLARNALEIYQRLGAPGQVALSFSSLAMIYIEERHYQDARKMARRALNINQCIHFTRGLGLAYLALSEATRRYVATTPLLSDDEKIQHIQQAESFAREAREHLEKANDRWYQIKALIEIGCVIRDKVKYCCPKPRPDDCDCDRHRVKKYRLESKGWLDIAANSAAEDYPILQADALANLAWLGYYAHDEALIEEAEKKFKARFSEFFDAETSIPRLPQHHKSIDSEEKSIWQFIGKLHVMKGALAFRKYEETKEDTYLEKMGKLYTQALQYSTVRGDNYGAILVGKQFIFDQLKTLSVAQLKALCRGVHKAEEAFGWFDSETGKGNSVMRQFLEERSLWYEEAQNETG